MAWKASIVFIVCLFRWNSTALFSAQACLNCLPWNYCVRARVCCFLDIQLLLFLWLNFVVCQACYRWESEMSNQGEHKEGRRIKCSILRVGMATRFICPVGYFLADGDESKAISRLEADGFELQYKCKCWLTWLKQLDTASSKFFFDRVQNMFYQSLKLWVHQQAAGCAPLSKRSLSHSITLTISKLWKKDLHMNINHRLGWFHIIL